MRSFKTQLAAILLIAPSCFPARAALFQAPPGPPEMRHAPPKTPPSNPEGVRYTESAGQSYLERHYGLSRDEAEKRLRLEGEVSETAIRLKQKFADAFLASIIDHTPVYQVTFVFSKDVPANDIRSFISPDLRPIFKIKRSRYTGAEIDARQQHVIEALQSGKIPASVGYDYRTDKLEVTASQEGGNKLLSMLPPELRSDVRFERGGTPGKFQSGASPGDAIYGGWMLHQLTSTGATAICTYGFVTRNSDGSSGIATSSAEHCQGQIGILYDDGHKVTLPTPPVVNKNIYNTNGGRSYDYRIFRTGSLTSGPYVWFWNNRSDTYYQYVPGSGYVQKTWANVNPNYPLQGAYSRVIGVIPGTSGPSNVNHPQGATRCKGGFTTGITCGEITLSEAAAVIFLPGGSTQTFYGYVKLEGTDYKVFSYGGDSGGPVTTLPLWNSAANYYDIKAAGIVEIGSKRDRGDGNDRPCITPDDGACPMYYLPIDRVNDHVPESILTTAGAVSPN